MYFQNFDRFHELVTTENMGQTTYHRHCSYKYNFKNSLKLGPFLPVDFEFEKIWMVVISFMACSENLMIFKKLQVITI